MIETRVQPPARYQPSLVLHVVLGISFFVVLRGIAGFYYETNDDAVMEMIFRGVLFPTAASREIGFAHLLTASALGRLYGMAPCFPWYGATLYLLSLAAILSTLVALDFSLGEPARRWQRMGILACLAFIFASQSVVLLQFTRVSILLGGSSILVIDCAARCPAAGRKCLVSMAFILFALAALIRPDSALLTVATSGAFVLLVASREALRRMALPIVALLLMIAAVHVYTQRQEERLRRAAPLLANILDYDWRREARLSSEDSLRLRAIRQWLFSDADAVEPRFLVRVSSPHVFDAAKLNWRSVARALAGLKANLGAAGQLLVVANVALFFLAAIWGDGSKGLLLRHMLGHALFWLALLGLGIFMKTPPRVLSPLVALYAWASFSTLAALGLHLTRGRVRLAQTVITTGLLLGCAATGWEMTILVARCRAIGQANEAFLKKLDAEPQSVAILSPGLRLFRDLDPLKGVPLDKESGRNRYILLGGWPCLLAAFDREVASRAPTARFPDLIAATARSGALFLSSDEYNAFLVDYLREMYGLSLSLSREPEWVKEEKAGSERIKLFAFEVVPLAESVHGARRQASSERRSDVRRELARISQPSRTTATQ